MPEPESRPNGTFEFDAIHAALENERRSVAAGKLQRASTVKWVITVNVALAAAATALLNYDDAPLISLAFAAIAVLISLIGYDLLHHYSDDGLSHARRAAWLLEEHLEHEYGIDLRGIAQRSKQEPAKDYDRNELRPFRRSILWSAVPAVLVAVWAIYQASPAAFSG